MNDYISLNAPKKSPAKTINPEALKNIPKKEIIIGLSICGLFGIGYLFHASKVNSLKEVQSQLQNQIINSQAQFAVLAVEKEALKHEISKKEKALRNAQIQTDLARMEAMRHKTEALIAKADKIAAENRLIEGKAKVTRLTEEKPNAHLAAMVYTSPFQGFIQRSKAKEPKKPNEKIPSSAYLKGALDGIGWLESNNQYNCRYSPRGCKYFSSYANHPRIKEKFCHGGKCHYSDAAGKYMFLSSTWDRLAKKHGYKDFSPKNQDLGAIELIKECRGYKSAGVGDYETMLKRCGGTWASFPGSIHNQGHHSKREVVAYMMKTAKKHAPKKPQCTSYKRNLAGNMVCNQKIV